MMKMILQKIMDAIYDYGKAGAGMASCRGSYEAAVPSELREQKNK